MVRLISMLINIKLGPTVDFWLVVQMQVQSHSTIDQSSADKVMKFIMVDFAFCMHLYVDNPGCMAVYTVK